MTSLAILQTKAWKLGGSKKNRLSVYLEAGSQDPKATQQDTIEDKNQVF